MGISEVPVSWVLDLTGSGCRLLPSVASHQDRREAHPCTIVALSEVTPTKDDRSLEMPKEIDNRPLEMPEEVDDRPLEMPKEIDDQPE